MSDEPTERDVEALDKTRAALRREIGPPTDRDDNWQPMVSAGEVRTLLDALDDHEAQIREEMACGVEAERLLRALQGVTWEGEPVDVALERVIAQARREGAAEAHGVAWENRLNIICRCGHVCNAVVKRSPAPLMGTTSDDYVASPAAEAFARHLREARAALRDTP